MLYEPSNFIMMESCTGMNDSVFSKKQVTLPLLVNKLTVNIMQGIIFRLQE